MRSASLLIAVLVVGLSSTNGVASASDVLGHEQVLLWPGGAPGANGNDVIDKPALTIHLVDRRGENVLKVEVATK